MLGVFEGNDEGMTYKRKLIEVALPLDAISAASAREKSIRHGHPSTLHLWWARRPLAAARAVLWASLVDDPSAHPDRFPTEADQAAERRRLFGILERLVVWKNSNDPVVLGEARAEIEASCDGELPSVLDPFCGGGTIPMEAQRLGLPAHGGDLNPVAVLISKALVEIPPRFAGLPPVNPDARPAPGRRIETTWEGAQGLAEDIGYYGRWMRDRAFERIGHLYPKVTLPAEEGGGEANVIAYIWARTVASPDPAWRGHVPLVKSWVMRKPKGNKPLIRVEPLVDIPNRRVRYRIREDGDPPPGTVTRRGGTCLATATPIPFDYIRDQGRRGLMGRELICMVAEGRRGRAYVEPMPQPAVQGPDWRPPGRLSGKAAVNVPLYGMSVWADLFTDRQLVALDTFSDLLKDVYARVEADSERAGLVNTGVRLRRGGTGSIAYADAVVTYLSIVLDRCAARWASLAIWHSLRETVEHVFGRQAIPMVWDYAEANPFSSSSGNWSGQVSWVQKAVVAAPRGRVGKIEQRNAVTRLEEIPSPVICTDPPYYDNISYAELSDFFYVWLRRNLNEIWPTECATMLTPKAEELVANPYRTGSKEAAKTHFEDGMAAVLERVTACQRTGFPATVFYAFKQQETKDGKVSATGWETFLQGLVDARLQVTATWPIRTEMLTGLKAKNAMLASSILIACRPRSREAPLATRREFLDALAHDLPMAIRVLQDQAIAPVDMAQSAIGPGMEVFSRYARVLEADGTPMPVRAALALINEALEEVLSSEETEFDRDTRWALTWYEQFGRDHGPFGDAETLAKAKNTSVSGVVEAGIADLGAGKVRLVARGNSMRGGIRLADKRITVWEVAQHLIARLDSSEDDAADLLQKVGAGMGDRARRLSYLLFQVADRKGWSSEAVAYNRLIGAWHDIERRAAARQGPVAQTLEGI